MGRNWVVPENDGSAIRPSAVCLLDGTSVLFRFPENLVERPANLEPEAEATFRMTTSPKRDLFQFAKGNERHREWIESGQSFNQWSLEAYRQRAR